MSDEQQIVAEWWDGLPDETKMTIKRDLKEKKYAAVDWKGEPRDQLTDQERREKLSAFIDRQKELVVEDAAKRINREADGALGRLSQVLANIEASVDLASTNSPARALDLVMDETSTFVAKEWDEHNGYNEPRIDVDVGLQHFNFYNIPNFNLKKNDRYRVIVIVEKVGEIPEEEQADRIHSPMRSTHL